MNVSAIAVARVALPVAPAHPMGRVLHGPPERDDTGTGQLVFQPNDGVKKSVGVILPATLTFNTGVPEIMEGVAGSCRVKLKGESEWKHYGAGESFNVPGDSSFDSREKAARSSGASSRRRDGAS